MISYEVDLADAWPLRHTWPLPALLGSAGASENATAGSADRRSPATLADREQVLKLAKLGAWECDLRTNALSWTAGVFELFGLPQEPRIHRSDTVALYCDESREAMELLRAYAIKHRRGFTMDARLRRPDGDFRWMRLTTGLACEAGRPVRLYGTKQDITAERARQECLMGAAEIDEITGLATRAAFEARLCAEDLSSLGTLFTIDVGDAASIGRRFGLAASDACLFALGSRIARRLDDALMIARTGEYQFTALVRASPSRRGLDQRLRRLLREIAEPIYWQGYLLRVAPAAGIAHASEAAPLDAGALLADAVAKMSAAKRRLRWIEPDRPVR